jgi:lantibiotic transport system ATP-binding protein
MSSNIIETKGLSYQFKKDQQILKSLNLQIPQGSIYGFLGPNGAGKTTTLKLILGLLRNQTGEINLFGKNIKDNRIEILKKTGTLIEQPSLYLHLTGKENLDVYKHIHQLKNEDVTNALAKVGLSEAANKKAKAYSLGMKQRLSLAIALLHNPSLLILDEPTNGLDPNGIIEMRELIKKLNVELGVSIVISSHLLAEIERIATHVGIINRGTLLFEGALTDLQALQQKQALLHIKTNNPERTKELLVNKFENVLVDNNLVNLKYIDDNTNASIVKMLTENNIEIYEIVQVKKDLEQIFLNITGSQN